MSQQMTPIPAAQQIQQLNEQLMKAYVARDGAQQAIDQANEQIKAIRSVMAGVGIGEKLHMERIAEAVKDK